MSNAQPVVVRLLDPAEDKLLAKVFNLAERHKRWLGMLPPPAYVEYVAKRLILVALRGEDLLGYMIFRLPKTRVTLVQLCVDPAHRRQGIAKLLVDELSRLHADREGIALRCRRDWPATNAWPRLGFEVRSNAPGRSREGHLLTAWWRDHGHDDLFSSLDAESARVTVAMDTNVFRDLHEEGRGERAEQSRALTADWLADDIELVLTPGNLLEFNAIDDAALRQRLLGTAHASYHIIGRPPADGPDPAVELTAQIVEGLPADDLTRDASLRNDAELVAQAAAGGAEAFVTRDENVVRLLAAAAAPFTDLWISTPADLIVHLDEIRDAASYSPVRLRDTGFTVAEGDARIDDELRPLLNHGANERRTQFKVVLRSAAQEAGRSGSRRVVRGPDGSVAAAVFFAIVGDELAVSFFRVVSSPLARTLANQLIHLLRQEAVLAGADRIVVHDRYLSPAVSRALPECGFQQCGDDWVAAVITGVLPWTEVAARLGTVPAEDGSVPAARVLVGLERSHWPLKVRDAGLKCFLVPIRPAPADALLGRDAGLWDSDPVLGLSRQHVYYRAPSPPVLEAPGRVLWYVSGERRVVASSRLDQVVVADPATLHGRFRHLGVLGVAQIEKQAKRGKAMAVRFGDTESFTRPVSLGRLRAINHRMEPLPSPREIDEEDFFRVYEEGAPG
ncbi:GNAT family N-acetyltransferase [Nocardioides sp. SYSU DS0651]|uniref:GNAT family N-acetyltransferase n=1 Tax=Nocardioides sp. SYSU DS0651 TaxID=3415955 RepID=UPI003F4CA1DB